MTNNMLLSKTCSIYASDLHFATIIFPFVDREIQKNTTIRTILEKDEQENIEKIIENIGLNSERKEKVKKVDWSNSDIGKIRETFKLLEKDIKDKKNVDVIVLGSNIFIEKVNKAIDLFVKNNLEELEKSKTRLNIINCFSFMENKENDNIINFHEYILKTTGIEETTNKKELLKAN